MKKILLAVSFILLFKVSFGQQYALFGTQTIFDAFENPSVKSFKLDSSKRYSSNFLLPYFGVNGANKGSAEYVFRKLTQEGVNDTRTLPIGTGEVNHFYENSNIYVATFRIFKSYKYQQELGFSWQVRSDAHIDYTNETLAIFDSYQRFPQAQPFTGIFNTKGYQQTYNQFSFTYRENYNKRLAFGVKASLLSGILYNKLNITDSYLNVNTEANQLTIGLAGTYQSNFDQNYKIGQNTFYPTFKNPGLSFGFSTNYTTKKGLFMMANIKDLGFIWWRKNTQQTTVNTVRSITDINQNRANTNDQIRDIFESAQQSSKFLAATNAKLDVYLSKAYGFYKPALAISKNLFYKGGDVAFVNTFKSNNLSASIIPLYNFNGVFMFGLQGKYQTPNFELFMGSDNVLSTATQAYGILKNDANIGSGSNGASFYMGVGIKFGGIVNHPQFADNMPGFKENEDGFFRRVFSIFRKK